MTYGWRSKAPLSSLRSAMHSCLMARKRSQRRRRMGRYLRGTVDETTLLGTLAGSTLISDIYDNVVNERTLVSSHIGTWTLSDLTPGAGVGPILVGIAHSDYTNAEIEEVIEATASWNEGDLLAQERAKRKVRRIGIFDTLDNAADSVVLNDGKPIKTKLNWILLQGQSLRFWAYNMGTGALATTDPRLQVQGHVNLFPR